MALIVRKVIPRRPFLDKDDSNSNVADVRFDTRKLRSIDFKNALVYDTDHIVILKPSTRRISQVVLVLVSHSVPTHPRPVSSRSSAPISSTK